MQKRQYAAGILALLKDHTVATQSLLVSTLLDAATHRPAPQWPSLQSADGDSGITFGGGGTGVGGVGPEQLDWRHLAFGYCGGRFGEERFTAEVGLHDQIKFDLAPLAFAVGLEPSRNPDASRYRLDADFGFPGFAASRDNLQMLRLWLARSGFGEPLGASDKIAGRMTWVRRHWRLKDGVMSFLGSLLGDKRPVNQDLIETDVLTWTFDTGDATTQFAARPIQPSSHSESDFKKTIEAARNLADRFFATLSKAPVNGEALKRRL
ncbi:hypothetical protein [Paludisphaera rhizosphaerae]|uniref:hypothetical protein n=1 Tax=Paludisphaera rhizosphaerae TaxID=2711216 RepID=UPI0013EC4AB2|nr:hypothetical protein [Paludisphaera rhizosphaerae]